MKQNMDFWVHYKWRLNLKILLKMLCKCPMAHSLHICKKVSFLLLYVAPLEYENTRPMNLALNFESRKEKKSIVRLLFRKIGRANLWGENMRLIIWIYGYLLSTQALARKVDWICREWTTLSFYFKAKMLNFMEA